MQIYLKEYWYQHTFCRYFLLFFKHPFQWKSIHINSDSKLWMTWASYQIRKIAGCACAGNAGNVFPRRRFQRKPIVSDPGMHHGTCVTHVPWCMSGSLTCVDGENVPGIPGACAPAILRIWQEAHATCLAKTKLYNMQYWKLTHWPLGVVEVILKV